jgi:homoserine dehydrogenase
MLQHPAESETAPHVPLVLVTHQTSEAAMQDALKRIGALSAVTDTPVMIRIEAA